MPPSHPRMLRIVTMLALASIVVVAGATAVTGAEFDRCRPSVLQAAERSPESLTVSDVSASLDASLPAIAAGDPFGFTARVRADTPVSYLQVRLKVYRPTGRLIFQRTRIENSVPAGTREFHFERATDDLSLRPGVYPVELQVTIQGADGRLEDVITSELRVYDPSKRPTDLVMVARIAAPPNTGPDGTLREDPAEDTAALDELDRLVRASDERDLRLTLVVPPMLLEEWKRISAGYELPGDGGPVTVPRDAETPTRYAEVLTRLAEAMDAGRVELLATGYSDPDLAELSAHGLRDDVRVQYQQGHSSLFASLESTPSTGSAPAGGSVPPAAAPQLVAEELGYIIVDARTVRRGEDGTVSAGVYRAAETSMVVVVADAGAAAPAASGEADIVAVRAYSRHASRDVAPYVFVADVGPAGRGTAEGFLRTASELAAQPWLEQRLGREVARSTKREVRLLSAPVDRDAPAGFWEAIASARDWADALAVAGGEGRRDSSTARVSSLLAESSVWSHADWALAGHGTAYAQAAEKAGRLALDPVHLSLESITLAGTDGIIPVTVSNDSGDALNVVVSATGTGNLRLTDDSRYAVVLQPQENFFEFPVQLQNALSGELTVSVRAGDLVIEEQRVTVRASYLDRLAIIGGVVLLLGGMLAYIIRRVRHAEAGGRVNEDDGRYTVSTQDSTSGSDV